MNNLPVGIQALQDKLKGGIRPGEIVCVGAGHRPYIYDTLRMMQQMAQCSRNHSMAYVSLEADYSDLEERIMKHLGVDMGLCKEEWLHPYLSGTMGPRTLREFVNKDKVFLFGNIKEAPHSKTLACKVVKGRGNIQAKYHYSVDVLWDIESICGENC